MKGTELVRYLRGYARSRSVEFKIEKARGKGSHLTLWLDGRKTIAPDLKKELMAKTLASILANLGVDRRDL